MDKGNEFYYRSMKSWLESENIEIYLTLNERKSIATGCFIRTLKKIFKDLKA